MKTMPIDLEELVTKVVAHDIVDKDTGEVIVECNEDVTEEKLDELLKTASTSSRSSSSTT